MRILKNTIAFFCLFSIATAHSQTAQDSLDLRRDLDTYNRVSKRLDIDSILTFMPPKMFDMAPKAMLKAAIQSAFENETFKIGFDTFGFTSMLPIVKIGDQLCSLVGYEMTMSFTMNDTQDTSMINVLVNMFAAEYGAENVRVDEKNGTRIQIVRPDNKFFALKEQSWDSWKFLEDKRGQGDEQEQQVMNTVIPKAVLEHFKK